MTEGFADDLWLGTTKKSETGKGMPVVMVENARKKLAAIMVKLPVRIAEAENVLPLGKGKQEEVSG